MSTGFRFLVDPSEDHEAREHRWDAALLQLQATGLTIQGTGPDGDFPLRYEFPDGKSIEETSLPLDGPFVEVYDTVPLEAFEHQLLFGSVVGPFAAEVDPETGSLTGEMKFFGTPSRSLAVNSAVSVGVVQTAQLLLPGVFG